MIITKLIRRIFICSGLASALSIVLTTGCSSLSSEYSIITPLETDSILSAWLIKTHVNSHATFFLVDPPAPPQSDKTQIPASENLLSVRYPPLSGATQFEQIAITEHIKNDACVDRLKEASRVLEIMAWRKSQFPAVLALESQLKEAVANNVGNQDFNNAFAVIDHWCEAQAKQG